MIQKGQLAYFKKVKSSYKPIGPAHFFKKAWDKVAMLWMELGDSKVQGDSRSTRTARVFANWVRWWAPTCPTLFLPC